MASKEENIKRFQEIANRGLQDQLPEDKRAIFDEAINRGLITMPSAAPQAAPQVQPEAQPVIDQPAPQQPATQAEADDRSFWQKVADESSSAANTINRSIQGVGETALAIGTSAIAEPLSGLAGMFAAIPGGKTPSEAVASTQEALTYQPRTQAGQQAMGEVGAVMAPVGTVMETIESGAGEVGYQLGNLVPGEIGEQVGAVTGSVFSAIPAAIVEILGFKGTRIAKLEKLQEAIDEGGVENVLTPESVQALRGQGFTDTDLSRVVGADPAQLERLERFKRQGVQPTRGDITQDTAQRKAEGQLVETAAGESAEKMRQLRLGQSQTLQTNFEELIDSYGDGIPKQTGIAIKEAIESKRAIAKADAKAAYDSLANAQGGADNIPLLVPSFNDLPGLPSPRELRGIKRVDSGNYNALQDALAEFGLSDDAAAIKRLTDEGVIPEQLNILNFEEFRQSLNVIRKADETGNMSSILTPIIKEVDRQIDIATDTLMTSGNPDLASLAKSARSSWQTYLKEFDPQSVAETLTKNKPRSTIPFTEVSRVYDKVAAKNLPIEQVDRLLDTLEGAGGKGNRAIAQLQSNVVVDLLDSAFTGSSNKIGGNAVVSGPALYKRFYDKEFNQKIQSIYRNNPEGYKQLEDLVATANDIAPGKFEAVKGSGNVILDLAQTLGVAKIANVPGIGLVMEQLRDLGARSKNRKQFNIALNARPDLKMASNDLVRSFPMLSAALGINERNTHKQT